MAAVYAFNNEKSVKKIILLAPALDLLEFEPYMGSSSCYLSSFTTAELMMWFPHPPFMVSHGRSSQTSNTISLMMTILSTEISAS